MPQPTQATRNIAIDTPLGEDVLLLRSFSGHEEISRLFEFDLDLLSEDYEINFDDIIGQNVTIRMELPEGGMRYWNGYINRFVQGVSTSVQFAQYRATMVPWLWFLTRTSDCRIFQEKTVPDIIKQVFNDLGFSDIEDRLSGGYRTWTYCVQYRETDFNFVSRLMEQEGIYYYFLHEQGKCTIVLCDSRSKHDPYGNYGEIDFIADTKGSGILERISEWTVEKRVRSGKFAHVDYNFEKPSTSLMSIEKLKMPHAEADYEIYDYPGEYSEKTDGDKYAKLRMEELAQSHEVCTGQSDSRGICSGYLFTLAKHSRKDQNREYLVVSTGYQAAAEAYETSDQMSEMCVCSFTVIPSSFQFRPERSTPKPIIQGSQTAMVTGPSGEEIYTDKHGRVKVQFHWDREGKRDENSSCWIRVSQAWAGAGWGAMYIPRIGHEVIVNFIEGDPDRPIITGRVYHGTNTPPYSLPDQKTRSTIKSMSVPDTGGVNEIRFEDKAGEEQLFIQAEKTLDTRAKDKCREFVGESRHLIITENQLELVEIDKNLTVKGDHKEKVSGTISIQSDSGDILEKAAMNYALDAGMEVHIKGGTKVVIEGGVQVSLKAGGSFIDIGPAGVSISGTSVMINSGGAAGSGSGCSPASPDEPEEADTTEPGRTSELPSLTPAEVEATELTPQALTFQQAAESGAPLCET
ncbi:MAG: type VI secretion system secreted protein VgrG [Desulfobacteraceae bacterium Eth-SRB2]|nr:MAG: type VI secretion system secreted protein VgrG [Desulfobacteraceae bacterium Eth-SRB2]